MRPAPGLVEEEVIEGEEFEAPRHHHGKTDEHDLDEYEEEEKTHTQIRSGELGEMLQEAHLDHRIQLNFDDKTGEVDGEDVFDIEDEEEEPRQKPDQRLPATASADTGQQRRERGGRGRRGGGRGTAGSEAIGAEGPSRRSAQTSDLPIISDLLKPGQEILVQIAKEPIAKKGARITSHIALPGRFLVFMPTVTHVGVSRKISSDEERAAAEADSHQRARRSLRRIHRPHRGRGRFGRRAALRSSLPDSPLGRDQAAL